MKLTKIKLCAVLLGVTVFAANIVSATPGYFKISGTAITDKSTSSGQAFDKTSFSTKDVLKLLANATGELWISNKNSQLVYDINAYNSAASTWYEEDVYGIFWVTNTTSHDSYRLDSSSGEYWSYIELDYYDWNLGFNDPYNFTDNTPVGENYAYAYKESSSKSSGKELGSDAILYVHDDPFDFDYLDYGGNVLFDSNDNAFVIRGAINLAWSNSSSKSTDKISLEGSGDGIFYDSESDEYVYPVMTGKATYSAKGTETMVLTAQ